MYNRYVPQPDGSYRRKQVRDPQSSSQPRPRDQRKEEPREERNHEERPHEEKKPECPPEGCQTPPERHEEAHEAHPPKHHREPCRQNTSAFSFLRNLLPNDFDTGDLLIVILLLLMAGDCEDGQNTALLTLALYLFM